MEVICHLEVRREGWGWFEASKWRKAIHIEIQTKMSGKQMFAGPPSLTMGHREDQRGHAGFLPITH